MTQHVISEGERPGSGHAATLGLSLSEGKATLASLQRVLVTAQADAHCRLRRRCGHCGASRPLKDHRSRRPVSLFGTVEVRAPRFNACRSGVACRRSLTPVAEIMPDRFTPEYERILSGMDSALPYRWARALLGELLPVDTAPEVETIRRRTLQVGARLERAALVPPDEGSSAPATATTPVTILSDGAQGPRSLAQAASIGPCRHVLDWFHLSMRVPAWCSFDAEGAHRGDERHARLGAHRRRTIRPSTLPSCDVKVPQV